jgi:hypothetical protein
VTGRTGLRLRILLGFCRRRGREVPLLRGEDVGVNKPEGSIAIMRLDNVYDHLMVRNRAGDPTGIVGLKTDQNQPIEFVNQVVFNGGEAGVARQMCHRRMKLSVVVKKRCLRGFIARDIAKTVQSPHGDIVGSRRLGRTGGRNDKSEAKELPHVERRDRVDAIALPRKHCNKLFLFKAKERVANGGSADMILFSKELLPKLLAGLKFAGQDSIPDRTVDAIPQ